MKLISGLYRAVKGVQAIRKTRQAAFLLLAFLTFFCPALYAESGEPRLERLPLMDRGFTEFALGTSTNPPDRQQAQQQPAAPTAPAQSNQSNTQSPSKNSTAQGAPTSKQQPKRILGVMPNYRAVSAGEIPPPPTPKQALVIATKNSFDYSSFIFVGITSAVAEWTDAHKQLGQGMAGYGRYYWRGFVDKTDGNYLVIFAYPTIFHQDERYYAEGEGGFVKRLTYAVSRIVITPNYEGHPSFNASELLGRGTGTPGGFASKFGYALLRDAATNSFREFWPDIATHVLHRHP
jgi:hypothetical protein